MVLLIAALNGAGAVIIVGSLSDQRADSPTMNLAGAQRMLCQKISKELLLLAQSHGANEADLRSSITRFGLVLRGLEKGDAGLGLPASVEPDLLAGLTDVENSWSLTRRDIETLIANPGQESGSTGGKEQLARALSDCGTLQRKMDDVVQSLETNAEAKLARTLWTEIVVAAAVIALLLVAWMGVIGPLIRDLKRLGGSLSRGSGQVAAASEQVAASSQSLARGASDQAASIEEAAASAREVGSMAGRNAELSAAAAELMAGVENEIGKGRENINRTVSWMEEIAVANDRICGTIRVIDQIAFQTNILALNASVEAARAGQAGLGFAVVAGEVRTLAQRSTQAAKDTAEIITSSLAKSDEGSERLDELARFISGIERSAARIREIVDSVNAGSREQARDLDQIAVTIGQMAHMTQETAAIAEESAASSRELDAEAATARQNANRIVALVEGR